MQCKNVWYDVMKEAVMIVNDKLKEQEAYYHILSKAVIFTMSKDYFTLLLVLLRI